MLWLDIESRLIPQLGEAYFFNLTLYRQIYPSNSFLSFQWKIHESLVGEWLSLCMSVNRICGTAAKKECHPSTMRQVYSS
jgi:hypothetical protein